MASPFILSSEEPHFGPGTKVAVIGAGFSGVAMAAHLLKEGLSVTVFERSGVAGGIWHYYQQVSESPPFSNSSPSLGDYKISTPGQYTSQTLARDPFTGEEISTDPIVYDSKHDNHELEIGFSPPGPCYAGLKNNVPTSLMISVLDPWPEGTEEITTWDKIEGYVHALARNHGVDKVTLFHTRVDEVRKSEDGTKWAIRTLTLDKAEAHPVIVERFDEFDAVVVAAGNYNMPRVPDIEGLKELKAAMPDRVIHSKQYRIPEKYRGQNILVIGAGVSSTDICRELDGISKQTYQSARGGPFEIPASVLPPNVTRVAEVDKIVFEPPVSLDQPLRDGQPIPGKIVLKDGRILKDIHHVVLGTGYITSFPFLPQLHSDSRTVTEAGEELLVTSEGNMTHNLHKDMFYINDPTLSFIGIPRYVATFSLFDHQAQVMARVLSGKVQLPSKVKMRREYSGRLQEKGTGRNFHSLRSEGDELAYVKDLVDWANRDAEAKGFALLPGHTEKWIDGYWAMRERMKALFSGGKPTETGS